MGIELFGAHYATYFAVSCFIAYFFSGHSGIYQSQRLGVPKINRHSLLPEISLSEAREWEGAAGEFHWGQLWHRRPPLEYFVNPTHLNPEPLTNMSTHHIMPRDLGKLRVYLKPKDRLPARGLWERLNPRPIYRELIHFAKQEGIGTAVAYLTHYGFADGGALQNREPEIPNPHLTVCVELVDTKDALEAFCRRHGELLQGKTVLYKNVEHWEIHPSPANVFAPVAASLDPPVWAQG
jgi:PII-like signaling protein